jgi:hypothetical protein
MQQVPHFRQMNGTTMSFPGSSIFVKIASLVLIISLQKFIKTFMAIPDAILLILADHK